MKKELRNLDKFNRNEVREVITVCNITDPSLVADVLEEVTNRMQAFCEEIPLKTSVPYNAVAIKILDGRYGRKLLDKSVFKHKINIQYYTEDGNEYAKVVWVD